MDIEGTIQFIVNQQAQFAADMMMMKTRMDDLQAGLDHLRETVSQLGEGVSQIGESVSHLRGTVSQIGESVFQLGGTVSQLGGTVSQLTGVVSELATSQQNTNAILENLAERAVESSERQDRTDERLNTLISIVERHVSNHP